MPFVRLVDRSFLSPLQVGRRPALRDARILESKLIFRIEILNKIGPTGWLGADERNGSTQDGCPSFTSHKYIKEDCEIPGCK
jgi:hypothetical protein